MASRRAPPAPLPAYPAWWGSLGVALLVLALFASAIPGRFVWDDQQFFLENRYMEAWSSIPLFFTRNLLDGAGMVTNLYRPLQLVTHFIDLRIWGQAAWGHHLTNVLLHATAAALWFRVMLGLLDGDGTARRSSWLAAFGMVALFFTHPLQVENVAYVSGRGEILMQIFMAAAALNLRRRPGLALLATTLGLASKEDGILIPVFLLGCEWVAAGYERRRIAWLRMAPFFGIPAAYVLLRLTVLNFQNTLNFYNTGNVLTENPSYRLFTYLSTLPKAAALYLFPADLHHERSWQVQPGLGFPLPLGGLAMLTAGAGGLALSLRRGNRLAAFGLLWALLATLPTSNLVVLVNALFYDHWFILPGLGLFIAAAATLRPALESARGRRIAAAAVVLALLPLGAVTVQQDLVWRDSISLFGNILKYEPRSVKAMNNLAMHLEERDGPGDRDRALGLYLQAIAASDIYAQTHHNLGMLLLRRGEEKSAEAEFRRAIAMEPALFQSSGMIGAICLKQGRFAEAAAAYREALRVYPLPAAQKGLADAERGLASARH